MKRPVIDPIVEEAAELAEAWQIRANELLTAEEKSIGACQMQRSPHSRLEDATMLLHPFADILRLPNRQPGQQLIGAAFRDHHQIVPELILRIGACQILICRCVQVPDVSGMAAVTPTHLSRCALEEQHCCAGLPCCQSGAQSRVPARAAEWEIEEFNRVVTDYEIARGFEKA